MSDYDVFSDPTLNPRVRGGGTLQFTMSDAAPTARAETETSFAVCDRPLSAKPLRGSHWTWPAMPNRAMQDGGARRDRTDDLMLAKHALYQLSYGPSLPKRPVQLGAVIDLSSARPRVTLSVVGPGGLEPPTSRLSGVCSNQLSYRPLKRSTQHRHVMAWR